MKTSKMITRVENQLLKGKIKGNQVEHQFWIM